MSEILPAFDHIPSDIGCLADYERRAQAHIAPDAWRYLQEGAGDERTLAANRAALDRIWLVSRVLADLRGGATAIELLGRPHAVPLMLAPIAYQRLAHPEGELAVARAAQALQTGMIVSTLSSIPLEDIAAAGRQAAQELGAPHAPLWFQLYLQPERRWSAELIRRAEEAGYEAIVVTVDSSIKRSSFTLPHGIDAANLRGFSRPVQATAATGAILFGTPLADGAPRWEDIAWVRAETRLPLIIKGVLAPEDARLAREHGADALVVSNHGGRVLDGLVPAIEMLADVRAATAGQLPLLVDGGIRSGTDVAKALALGATSVLLGRPFVHALAVAGMVGVAHALHIVRAELELAMAQLGCDSPSRIGAQHMFVRRQD